MIVDLTGDLAPAMGEALVLEVEEDKEGYLREVIVDQLEEEGVAETVLVLTFRAYIEEANLNKGMVMSGMDKVTKAAAVHDLGSGSGLWRCFRRRTAWSIWLARNQFVFKGRVLTASEIVSRASSLWGQYLDCHTVTRKLDSSLAQPITLCVPPTGFIKINVDAAVRCFGIHGPLESE